MVAPSVLDDPLSFTNCGFIPHDTGSLLYDIKSAMEALTSRSRCISAHCNNISLPAAPAHSELFSPWMLALLRKKKRYSRWTLMIGSAISKSQRNSSFLWATDSINSLACLRSFQFPLSFGCQHFNIPGCGGGGGLLQRTTSDPLTSW